MAAALADRGVEIGKGAVIGFTGARGVSTPYSTRYIDWGLTTSSSGTATS
jgi:hypothetical protein